ncbi:hypothetical protein [Arcanobacterium hippocoleae]
MNQPNIAKGKTVGEPQVGVEKIQADSENVTCGAQTLTSGLSRRKRRRAITF